MIPVVCPTVDSSAGNGNTDNKHTHYTPAQKKWYKKTPINIEMGKVRYRIW